MKRALILVGLAALAACSTLESVGGGGSIGNRSTWRCDGGHAFRVGFTHNGAQVSVGGRTYILPHAQSASGARYSNGSVEYWEHAGQVQLSGVAGGPYVNCRRR
jgi:membrane-bound inhibitor of C-type lysozyme